MLFNSYIFVLLFLPICIIGYFGLNRVNQTLGLLFLIGMSLWFYGYTNPRWILIIVMSIVVNYGIHVLMVNSTEADNVEVTSKFLSFRRKGLLFFGIAFNIGLLFYFKYLNFFLNNVKWIISSGATRDTEVAKIVLPLGVSFYTFQQLSFIIDSSSGNGGVKCRTLIEYAAYVTFFPQLVAGPIVAGDVLIPQLSDSNRKNVNYENLSKGLILFTIGMFKKVLLADTFGKAVDWGYGNIGQLDTTNAIIVMLSYTFQIYFDFSGYSDMAMGLGWMLNIDLPLNFDSPYKAANITEFWKKWHITLTDFFRKYVYFPLGGSRKGAIRTYRNIFIIFALSGLWHGADWTFVIWGIMHGMALMFERAAWKWWSRIPKLISWFPGFVFINIVWIFFRADNFVVAGELIGIITELDLGAINPEIMSDFILTEFSYIPVVNYCPWIGMLLYFVFGFGLVFFAPNPKDIAKYGERILWLQPIFALILAWCVFSFGSVSDFLYFNF